MKTIYTIQYKIIDKDINDYVIKTKDFKTLEETKNYVNNNNIIVMSILKRTIEKITL